MVSRTAWQNARVLLVEDDEDDSVLVRELLGEIEHQWFDLAWVRNLDV